MSLSRRIAAFALALAFAADPATGREEPPARGSIIEDRAARKLMQAGDARLELGEDDKAMEIWESVIDRYPSSPVRFEARLRLADHLLEERREFDRARLHYEAAATEANEDPARRARAMLRVGVCHYEAGRYGPCFRVLREVIEKFPASPEVNEAYHHIGLAHFKQGHYGRAIEALERVGTVLTDDDSRIARLEAGKRLHVRIEDLDLAILDPGAKVRVSCRTTGGDVETIDCDPQGRGAAVALGAIPTRLGPPVPGNGILELRGGDRVTVTYIDAHTSTMSFDEKRLAEVEVVGNAVVRITDGGYDRDLSAAVLGKPVHLEITDADLSVSDDADELQAAIQILRRKTTDEIDAEIASRAAAGELADTAAGETAADRIDPWRIVRSRPVTLVESEIRGTFRAAVPLVAGGGPDDAVEAAPGQILQLVYDDERHLGDSPRTLTARASVIEGNLGEMRVARAEISDRELRLKTRLRTAFALTEVGNHYREFGLEEQAGLKYAEALEVCEDILDRARESGGELLEETYVQLWRIYFAMDQLDLALAMSRRLLAEFPESAFVDEAMIQQAHVERERGNFTRAIGLYSSLARLPGSALRGEGQYHVGLCYEKMALAAGRGAAPPLFEKAFVAYREVYENFPDSGRVGDAVARMAAFYYQKEDYARAVDVFENVLADHPDANFLDVILFNYGRCLFKLGRRDEARRKFDRLIRDFPTSEIAPEAKKIVDALKEDTP